MKTLPFHHTRGADREAISAAMPVLRIADYELDLPARELRCERAPVTLERRAFDLLAYLVQHRERVVPKEELLRVVWADQIVTDAALARAVMMVRKAFDPQRLPAPIRSVPRVGYRFVGPVREEIKPTHRARDDAPLAIAVLPFENRTGDERLQWIEFGLMSLLTHALDQDGRLSPVCMGRIVSSVESPVSEQLIGLRTGARFLVRVSVVRDTVALGAEVSLVGPDRTQRLFAGAADAVSLVPAVARLLSEALFPGQAYDASRAELPSDPMAAEAFGRALQAMTQQKFSQAAALFKMSLSLAPGLAAAEFGLLNALAEMGAADEADTLAAQMVAKAEHIGDSLLAARVDLALVKLNLLQRSTVAAEFRLNSALKLGEGQLTLDEQGLALVYKCQIALFRRDFESAQRYAEQMEAHARRTGNRLQLCDTYITRAIVAGCRENYGLAAQLSEEGVREARALRASASLAANALNASHALIELDQFQNAADYAEEALATAALTRNAALLGFAARDLGMIYRFVRVPEAIQRVLASMPDLREMPKIARNLMLSAQGHHAATVGDHALAVARFREAVEGMRDGDQALQEHETLPWLIVALIRAGRMQEAETEIDAASRPAYAANARLQGHLTHCRAMLEHARGHRQGALALLRSLLSAGASPLWHHWALLDAACLLAEDGAADEAKRLLMQVDARHLAQQRIGYAVAARVAAASGDLRAAARHQSHYLESLGGRRPASPDVFESPGPHPMAEGGAAFQADVPFLPSRL